MDRLPNILPISGHASVIAEVLEGPERRRRWSAEEKARIVAESLVPGAIASVVARRYGLHRNQLYGWRRAIARPIGDAAASEASFARVVVADEKLVGGPRMMEIAFGGAVVRVSEDVDPGLLTKVLQVLKRL